MDNDFKVLLQAVIDASGIGKSSLDEVQKILNKYHLNLTADLNRAELIKTIRHIVPELEKELKKITGIDIQISDDALMRGIRQYEKDIADFTKKVNKIQIQIDDGTYDAKIADMIAKTEQWTDASGKARISVKELNDAYTNLTNAKTDTEKVDAARKLDEAFKKTANDIRIMNSELAKDSQVQNFHQKVQAFYDKNTAAHSKWGKELKQMLADTATGSKVTNSQLEAMQSRFLGIGDAARQAGKLGKSWFDSVKDGVKTFTQWTSATTIVMKVFQKFKEGTQFIRELDDALTDVAYTSNVSQAQLNNLGDASIKMSKDLKASAENVFEAVKIYSTANATADDILRKSKPAIMLSNVSGMSGSESAKTIQTSLNQFEIEDTEEGLLDIVDTLEYVSSQLNYDFTEGMKQITEGIEASGSVAKNAGLNMQEYSAMVGIAVEKTGQSGSTIGNAYKTILSRITKASEIEGTMAEDISKAEEALRGVDVQVRDSANNFRDMSDIMADIGEVWDGLTDTQKAKIGYEVAGIRQLNVLNSLFGAWDEYSSIMENIDDRAGTALKNQEEYADSLNGRIQELGATGKSIWNNIFDTRDSKNVVSMGTSLLGIIDDITGALGTWGTLGAGAGIFAAFKNFGRPKIFGLKSLNVLKLPKIISVLWDTKVFLWSNVKYTG